MKIQTSSKIIAQVSAETEMANQLHDMVVAVLQQKFALHQYQIRRYSPICWRVERNETSVPVLSVVLERQVNGDDYFFVIECGDFRRPTSDNTSGQSLLRTLNNLFFAETRTDQYCH
jgi:hypothetical protein